ncbi:uncharacterized protein EDB93DRAFT_1073996 [Suillus bovinus]|uniref:uncharacterized protein n=1 Tax=Suillus bovinus TaxID=48563 RepID=UPI001B87073E|nr:uncharacterized protein EDB93DRAFT_1073996 [Suillus bovinus]KAG2159577.1 hypothetical protein EDB93DRAFT_1073996 [Suillus bovinus]
MVVEDGAASDFDATLFCATQRKSCNTRATRTTVCFHVPPPCPDSETEPESDVPPSLEKACPTDVSATSTLSDSVAQLVNAPKTHSSDPISAVNSAVKTLESLDFSLIRKVVSLSKTTNTNIVLKRAQDTSLHGTIQESSTSLLEFLHVVLTMSPTSAHDVRCMMESLAYLLRPSFLNLLFQYRRLFHALAVQELNKVAVIPIIISWVDAVLARLGDVALCVASAMHDRYFDDELPEALRKRREEDNLRAAAQLPDRWDSVPSILTSEKASPAAKRLALRLLVSRYVLQPQLALHPRVVDAPLDDSVVSLLPYLTDFMQHTVVQLSESSPLHAQHQSAFQERMNCAMLLSLFALVDLTTGAKDTETDVPFRPHTLATVMRLIRFVMLVDNTLSVQTIVSPCPDLDAPRVVLILWRHFVPWTWKLLTEYNGSDSEIIIFLTTTWLHNAFDSNPQTTISTLSTFTGDEHGKYMICVYLVSVMQVAYFSRLLVYLSSTPRPRNLTMAQTDVLLKTCRYFVHWSDSDLLGIRKSSDCCRYLTLLFVYLSCIENGHDGDDYVTHAMARMQPRSLRDGWKQAIQESSTFCDELEKSRLLAHLRFHRQLLEDKPDRNYIRKAKQFLDFFTIECFSNVQISNQKLIIDFLEATMEYLRRESAERELPNLSASFLSCLTAFQRGQPGIRVCDAPLLSDAESVWQVATDSTTPELAIASAFALHIILSRRLPDSLTQVEAWDYLRNVLLMIASQDYLGDESPLALVVNPTICNALSQLLRHADEHTTAMMQSSPWTSHLQSVLQRIQSSDNCPNLNDYSSWLKKRISKPATNLMDQVGSWN